MKKLLLILTTLVFVISCKNGEVVTTKNNKVETLREYKADTTIITPKRKIAITSFKVNNSVAEKRNAGANLADIMATELVKSGRFIVLERNDIDKVLGEINFSKTLGEKRVSEIQNLLDADFIVTGAITKYTNSIQGKKGLVSSGKEQRTEITFDFKIIDVRTGEVILADSGEGLSVKEVGTTLGVGTTSGYDDAVEADALRAAAIDVLEGIIAQVDKTDWTAKVIKTDKKEIYINAGVKSNLQLGTKLSVYKQGEAIVSDGIFYGYDEKLVGTAKVVRYLGENAAVCEYDGDIFSGQGVVRFK